MPALRDAYRRTTYRAETPLGTVNFRIDTSEPLLDRLLEAHGAADWALITAFNPHSVPLGDAENARRHEQLVARVRALGKAFFEGAGVPDDGTWQPERSLLVLDLGEDGAVRLGAEFEQNAIVVGARGTKARLRDCAPSE